MVPILMYHQVTARVPAAYTRYTVTPAGFARQMRLLAALGYRTISLDQLLASRTSGTPLRKRSVVITFDDGFTDAIRHAVPELVKRGFTATFFVVASLVGRTSEWTRRRGIEMALADASELRRISGAGFTIGSHTLTHSRLADLDDDHRGRELADSKRRLEEMLGQSVRHLAYPYGSANERVRQAAAECGYETACTIVERLSSTADDPLMLPRVAVEGSDSLTDFVFRVRTGRAFGSVAQRVRVSMNVSDFAR